MIEFVQKYWVEVIFSSILSVLSVAVKVLYARIKKERSEQSAIKEGVIAILHDRLYQICMYHINKKYVTIQSLRNLEYLYLSYTKLGGNGTGTELYQRCIKLPIERNEDEDI